MENSLLNRIFFRLCELYKWNNVFVRSSYRGNSCKVFIGWAIWNMVAEEYTGSLLFPAVIYLAHKSHSMIKFGGEKIVLVAGKNWNVEKTLCFMTDGVFESARSNCMSERLHVINTSFFISKAYLCNFSYLADPDFKQILADNICV